MERHQREFAPRGRLGGRIQACLRRDESRSDGYGSLCRERQLLRDELAAGAPEAKFTLVSECPLQPLTTNKKRAEDSRLLFGELKYVF